jgi:hypothetical protein
MTPAERNGLMGLTSVVLTTPAYDASKRVCPVCRAPCSVKRIIPIYVRGTDATPTAVASSRFSSNSSEHPEGLRSRTSDNMEEDVVNDDGDRMGIVEDASSDEQETIRMDTSYSRTGLRMRFPSSSTSRGEDETTTDAGMAVPRRPVARSSSNLQLAERDDVASAVSASSRTTTHPASLSHGMLPFVQQALRHAAAAGGAEFVPPLHRLEGMHSSSQPDWAAPVANRESTEFLSWLLLLLGSFVLFCLLLF